MKKQSSMRITICLLLLTCSVQHLAGGGIGAQILCRIKLALEKVCDLQDNVPSQLDVVESKIDIADDCLAVPITGPTTISSSGNYCLRNSFSVGSGDGITIAASNVNLDLNNKIISGTGGDNGVVVQNGQSKVTIRNGTICDMGSDGVQLNSAIDCVVEHVTVIDNVNGIHLDGGTGCKIKNVCAANNSEYGIKFAQELVASNGSLVEVVSASLGGSPATDAHGSKWSPSGRFLAVPGNGNAQEVRLFEFDGSALHLISLVSSMGDAPNAISWSPDERYIAVGLSTGAGDEVKILEFDTVSLSIVATRNLGSGNVNDLSWSPDGKFIATAENAEAGGELDVLQFDGSTITSILGMEFGVNTLSVDWSPDSRFLAVGLAGGDELRVFSFDDLTLDLVDSVNTGDSVNSVSWSPNQCYLATGDSDNDVKVYSFDGSTLTLLDTQAGDSVVNSVSWSPDGLFLVSSEEDNVAAEEIKVWSFDGSSLTQVATATPGGATDDDVNFVDWSPNGRYIISGNDNHELIVYEGLSFPTNCVVDSCFVQDTNSACDGIGISASSAENVITRNTSFDNVLNYAHTTNVVKQFVANLKNLVPPAFSNFDFQPQG